MGDVSRYSGGAMAKGRGRKPSSHRRAKQNSEAPVSGVSFDDPADGLVRPRILRSDPNAPEIPIRPVIGRSMQDQLEKLREDNPRAAALTAILGAVASGEVEGTMNIPPPPARRR